jgi:hypothetical protein
MILPDCLLRTLSFHQHATVHSFLILQGDDVAGRFTLIHDQKLPDYVQVSFFEAQPGLSGVAKLIVEKACSAFPHCKRIVIGLNGHLNYGAGILTSNFGEAPVFGLPYNREYYQDYFPDFTKIPILTVPLNLIEYLQGGNILILKV